MAKPTKPEENNKQVSKASAPARSPRVRKTETVRERNQKAMAKAEAKSTKPESKIRRGSKKVGRGVYKPLRKPLRVITSPFRTRPMRFIGRVLGRIFWPKYFRNSFRELKEVTWPSRKDTWKLVGAVLVFALVFGLAAAGTDFVLDKIIQRIVFRG